MTISLFDTAASLAPLRGAIDARIAAVLDRGTFVLGPEVEAFEREFAAYIGVKHAIGVANGTDAITIALRALGAGPGDEVVVPSFTFYATAEAVVTAGCGPVFCDVDPSTRNVTVETVRAALTPACKAIVAVDLFGVPAPVGELREAFGLPVLEDAAQAAGAVLNGRRAGALGDAATFSFYPSKNLGALATVARSRPTMMRSQGSSARSGFTALVTRRPSITSATTRASTSCRQRSYGCCCPSSTVVRRPPGGRQAYVDAGLGEFVTLPSVPDGRPAGLAPVRRLAPRCRRPATRPVGRRHRRARLLPHPDPPPTGDGALHRRETRASLHR